MPQRYLPRFADKNYVVGFGVIERRPHFATVIGEIASAWSYAENELGGLFGILLGTESPAAHQVFLILRRWANQRAALDAAAKSKLSGRRLDFYNATTSEYSALERERNNLLHSCMGICEEDEDMLFAIGVREHVVWQADVIPKLETGTLSNHPHDGLKESMYVYTMPELVKLKERITEILSDMLQLNDYLRRPNNAGSGDRFSKLYNSPRIQRRITALHNKN